MGIYTTIEQRLELLDKANEECDEKKKEIAILGAGVAGLSAAYELKKRGHNVVIYEANKNRSGGRIWTHRFKDGQYHEFGAMRIPASHDYTRHYIKEFGLKLRPFITAYKDLDCYYNINGKITRIKGPTAEDRKKLLKLIDDFRLSPQSRKTALEKVAPAIFGVLITELLDELSYHDLQSLFGEVKRDEFSGRIKELDQLSLDEFLDNRLNDPDSKDLIYKTTGLSEFKDYAITLFLRDDIIGTGNGLEEIVGGFDNLPKAFEKKLSIRINYGYEVKSIEVQPKSVKVKLLTKEKSVNKEFNYVLCTIPYSKLRTEDVDIQGLSNAKRNVIKNWGYSSSTKVLFHCTQRFWETDENILGGASITDRVSKQTYYPSDNLDIRELPSHIEGSYGSLYTSYEFSKVNRKSKAVSEGPGPLVGSYCWGEAAREIGSYGKEERKDVVLKSVETFHPQIRTYVDDVASIFWDEYEWTKAAFSFMKPGDLTRYYHDAIANEGRLYFAGEHCSVEQGWIQGALISALREVERILKN